VSFANVSFAVRIASGNDGWAAALHATWTGSALYVIGNCNPGGVAVILAATTGLQRAWDVMAVKRSGDGHGAGLEEAPHYHGHRERLRARFREAGSDAVTDYELLELVLFRAMPRRDIKPLAKSLIGKFGSFAVRRSVSPRSPASARPPSPSLRWWRPPPTAWRAAR
jgi:hypothetical protein